MAQEYIAAKQKNNIGIIALSKSVFQTIAQIAVEEEENLMLGEGNSLFKYAATCKIQEDQLVISLDVKIKYNTNVNDACARLQNKLYETIEHMSGYAPDIIDIHVVGFYF